MPMELTGRQKTILDALIHEYVARAEPVASAEIARKYRLPYSSATIRADLLALDEAGYLEQPHTSAGRVPTDKGYRYFIQNLAAGNGVTNREERALEDLRLRALGDPFEFMKRASRILAELTHNLVLTGFPEEDFFYKSGLSDVMREPEFSDLTMMHEFSVLVDMVEDDIMRAFDLTELVEPKTFIGTENPIRRARHYSMIVASCATPFDKEGVVAMIGPKRMDYEHNIALLRHFREMLMV